MKKLPILYNFKRYAATRQGLFSIHNPSPVHTEHGKCELLIEQHTIIGETDNCFIYELQESEGEWVGDKVIKNRFMLPLGIHKSRLVEWTSGQLSIF